ncbi:MULTISPECIES: Mov34/MPN/PAD-1 family protein [unclassified Caballeronia]|uniref:C40 family peptidase n=1 Tax=unclassified Caballeronia TaxID=2646786 RepID=UPI00285AF39F|nr:MULTISPECIES: Mov34/MPN/PAD-1 family protein [unclassified Caballeronia]MDR5777558.1 Mov34/MPN/PAD-1 family protein [Caballeronia sp. LZ002]MDR5801513.1 Mov34/MPN/PAD-1 family protein [Caballeronia sp. LZ001]
MLAGCTRAAIESHALACYPNESCGLIVNGDYLPCANVSNLPSEHFSISAAAYSCAEDVGSVQAIVHSHPDASALPSLDDLLACGASGVPVWFIQSVQRDQHGAVHAGRLHHITAQVIARATATAPLIGARFVHGVDDCYGVVRRYYHAALGLELPDFERAGKWWTDTACSLYLDNYEAAGFISLGFDARLHTGDVLLMAIASRYGVPNHAAVYLGNDEILHHLWGQLSRRELLPRYRKHVTHVLRHRETINWKM